MAEIKGNQEQETQLWDKVSKGKDRSIGFYFVVVLILIVIGFVLGGFGSISFSVDSVGSKISFGSGVNYFWPGIAVQQVGSIWFGAWGILAGLIFPFFSNAVTQTSIGISFAYLPANFLQSFLPAYIFRRFKLDPRLQSGADYVSLLIVMFIGNLLGAMWSVFALLFIFEKITWSEAAGYFFGWFGGNMLAGVVFNFVLLKALSQWIIRSDALVKKWWS